MGYATKFHQNLDTIYIAKALDQDLSQKLSRVSFLLSFSLVAYNDKCPRMILLQQASLIEESNKYQGDVLYYVQHVIHLGFITEVPRT